MPFVFPQLEGKTVMFFMLVKVNADKENSNEDIIEFSELIAGYSRKRA